MADYGKITTDGSILNLPNPYRTVIANPTETQKKLIAEADGWLEKVYTEEPEYDPETQYLTEKWIEQGGKAVEQWEIHDKPIPEPSIKDRVETLEENVSDMINGVTE